MLFAPHSFTELCSQWNSRWPFCNSLLNIVTCSYDYKDEAVTAEAERVLSLVDNCVQKGLKWSVTRFDVNEKMEYVIGCLSANYD